MSFRSLSASLVGLPLVLASCSEGGGSPTGGDFLTSSVVFGTDTETTYIATLQDVAPQTVDYTKALEKNGWSDVMVTGRMAFVTDGEAPVLTRYAVSDDGVLVEDGRLSFANYAVTSVSGSNTLIVDETKAYVVVTAERQVIVWNPTTLAITGTFDLPELPNRGALRLVGPSVNRASAVRGDRAYLAFYWADFTDYSMADDSVVVVVDTATDTVAESIAVPCPEINFASVDEANDRVYFSNWGFSAVNTAFHAGPHACAVRLDDGATALDPSFQLTFSDVTGGREGATLRVLDDGKVLLTVFHPEIYDAPPTAEQIADGASWHLWSIDLATNEAAPFGDLGYHSFGVNGARVGDETLLFLPSADWASTTTYALADDGTTEARWTSAGWQTRLVALR